MNNFLPIIDYNIFNQYENQLNILRQDIKRLERRITFLEKNGVENYQLHNINPTPMVQNKIEAMNNLYSRDNYMI